MTVFLLRGSHANQYELQNYEHNHKKHNLTVVSSLQTLTPVNLPNASLWSPADLPSFPYRRQLLNRLIGGEQWLIGLENLVKQEKAQGRQVIIHTTETYTPYTHQAVELKSRGLVDKLICTCWETIPHNNEKFDRLRRWKQAAYNSVDTFHTPTQLAKEALLVEGVGPSRIQVIPYGVDLDRFMPTKSKKSNRRLRILTVARLETEKGMATIEHAANDNPQCEFLVVGKGKYRFRQANIIVSSYPYSEIHHAYGQADIYLHPSLATPHWSEQYGMALIEAMASGLPIIASDSGAIPEVLGPAGLIYPHSDPESCVRHLQDLLASPRLRRDLGLKARRRAQTLYDCRRAASNLTALY